jgi:uncharacterized protein (TIGR02453 family)
MQEIFDFLRQLEQNNTVEWMRDNRPDFQRARSAFSNYLGAVIAQIRLVDPDLPLLNPDDCIYRPNRATSIARNHLPFFTCFRATLAQEGRLPIPVGYYISLEPDGRSYVGAGLYAGQYETATALVRKHIAEHPNRFLAIVEDPAFKKDFPILGETGSLPRSSYAASPAAAYLGHTRWYTQHAVGDDVICDAVAVAQLLVRNMPLNQFLNEALLGFKYPV